MLTRRCREGLRAARAGDDGTEAFPKPIVAAVNGTREGPDAWLVAHVSR
ncbi:hypothetical protein [Bradyrhizobium liaoningense]|nr:hypothetical protein [Bradyrhizobium liaoningense]MBR0859668.1 hypothetical protein [Bradyrhizobium liaoningense]